MLMFAFLLAPLVQQIHPASAATSCQPNCVIDRCLFSPPSFVLTVSPQSQTIEPGQSAQFAISATSICGYNGPISLTTAITDLSASFSPTTICVLSSAPFNFTSCSSEVRTSILKVSAVPTTPNRDYTITVTGTNSTGPTPTSTMQILVTIPSPFTISSPTLLNAVPGVPENSTVTVLTRQGQSIFGTGSTVALSSSITPPGPALSLRPDKLTMTASGTAESTLTFGPAPLGNYTVTIMGSSIPFSVQDKLMVRVTDFNVSVTSASGIFQAGRSYNYSLTVNSLNGFAGEVHLSAYTVQRTTRLSFNAQSFTLAARGKVSTTFTVSVPADSAGPGPYTVNITATSRTLSHSIMVNFTVTPNPVPPLPPLTILGLQPLHFYGMLGGVATAVVVGAAVTISRRRKSGGFALPPGASMREKSAPSGNIESGENPLPIPAASTPPSPTQPLEAPRRGISKIIPSKIPGFRIPGPMVEHKVPILLVSGGTALVVAALATISPQAGLFGGLFIPGIILLGLGSFVLFIQLYQRPIAVRRFCMLCSFPMATSDIVCGRCHREQIVGGVDTRPCPSCAAVNPAQAKFCRNCGAPQPAS